MYGFLVFFSSRVDPSSRHPSLFSTKDITCCVVHRGEKSLRAPLGTIVCPLAGVELRALLRGCAEVIARLSGYTGGASKVWQGWHFRRS